MHEFTIAKITTISDMVYAAYMTVLARHTSCISYAFKVAPSHLMLVVMQCKSNSSAPKSINVVKRCDCCELI